MINKQNDNEINSVEKTAFRQYLPIICTVTAGVLISFILFAIVKKWDHENQRIEFESRSMEYANAVQHTIHDYEESLKYLGDFFNNSEQVTRKEFSDFVMSAIARHPGIQALGWNPLILNSERAEYESLAQEEGFENFMFTERAENNELVRAARRDEYVIVYYIEPLASNKPAFGYDIASNPTRLKAINKSFDTGNLSSTERITLVQESGEQFGILLLLPIYKQNVSLKNAEDRRKHRKGFVVEVLRIGDAVESALAGFSVEEIDMYLYDLSAEKAMSFLYFRPAHNPGVTKQPLEKDEIKKGLYWSKNIDLADRQWQIMFSPSSLYLESHQSWQAWIVLSGSLLLTFLLASYITRKSKYEAEIEQSLKEQTQISLELEKEIFERKKMGKALNESEGKYLGLFNSVFEGILVHDKGQVIEVNSAFTAMFGYSRSELMDINAFNLIAPESLEIVREKVKSGFNGAYEAIGLRRDGSKFIMEMQGKVISYEDRVVRIAAVRDISQRKKSEEALNESEIKFRSVVESSPMGIHMYHLEPDNRLVFVGHNNAADRILGVDNSQFIGKTIEEAFPPLTGTEVPERYRRAASQGDPWSTEQIRYEDGVISGAFEVFAFRTGPNKMVAMFLDITEKTIIKNALVESERRYRNITDHSSFGISTYDETGNCIVANKALAEIIGATVEQVQSQNFYHIKSWQTSGLLDIATEVLLSNEIKAKTIHTVSTFGKDVWLYCTFIPYYEKGKKFLLFITENISGKKQAENEQQRLNSELFIKNKELEQVLYVASHDLRSPLVNIEGYSMELEYSLEELRSKIEHEDLPSDIKDSMTRIMKEEIPESLYYIRTSVSKMEMLLKGVLSLSRLGRFKLSITDINMNEIMADIVDNHQFRLKELNITLDVSELPHCRGDRSQVHQVFSNILDNAIKYADAERSSIIKISGYSKKNQSVYCVEDNGIGISPEHQEKIFKIFYQLEPGRVKGEGMGLTIAHRIIERLKGKIWVESAVGRGSKFFAALPS